MNDLLTLKNKNGRQLLSYHYKKLQDIDDVILQLLNEADMAGFPKSSLDRSEGSVDYDITGYIAMSAVEKSFASTGLLRMIMDNLYHLLAYLEDSFIDVEYVIFDPDYAFFDPVRKGLNLIVLPCQESVDAEEPLAVFIESIVDCFTYDAAGEEAVSRIRDRIQKGMRSLADVQELVGLIPGEPGVSGRELLEDWQIKKKEAGEQSFNVSPEPKAQTAEEKAPEESVETIWPEAEPIKTEEPSDLKKDGRKGRFGGRSKKNTADENIGGIGAVARFFKPKKQNNSADGAMDETLSAVSEEDAAEDMVFESESFADELQQAFLEEMQAELQESTRENFQEGPNEMWETLHRELQDEVRAELRRELQDGVRAELRRELQDEVRAELRQELQDGVRAELRRELQDDVRNELHLQIRDGAVAEIRQELRESLRDEVKEELCGEMAAEVHENLKQEMAAEVAEELRAEMPTQSAYLIRRRTGEVIPLRQQTFTVGKMDAGCDYVIRNNNAISRIHAIIRYKATDNEYVIVDCNSTNHIYLNGRQIPPERAAVLKDGMRIHLALEEFVFQIRG